MFRTTAILLLLVGAISMSGQNCTNLNFSNLDFTHWTGRTGTCCPIVLTTNGFVAGRHTIITTQGTDPRTCNVLKLIPPGYTQSVRLGNQSAGSEAESISYTMVVDSDNALFLYSYAPVLQYPVGHTTAQQPRFEILIRDGFGNMIQQQCTYYIVYGNTNSGFSNCNGVVWKDWTTNGVDLRNYIGQSITLEFRTGDCSLNAHFGYAYLVGRCQSLVIHSSYCAGLTTAVLTAPDGFASYLWSNGATTKSISIPNPTIGQTMSCTLTSVTGCVSSVSMVLSINPIPKANYTVNNPVQCQYGNSFSFVNTSSVSSGNLHYYWDFGDGTYSDLKNPIKHYSTGGIYNVRLITISEHDCSDSMISQVRVLARPNFTTTIQDHCSGNSNFKFKVDGVLSDEIISYLWDFGDGTYSMDEIPVKKYLKEGTYTVKLTIAYRIGCIDSASASVNVTGSPIARFDINDSVQCLNGNNFIFTNNSTISSGSLTYFWDFGDGSFSTKINPAKTYNDTGTYLVKLTANSDNGCTGSITKTIILSKTIANFKINDAFQCVNGNNFVFINTSSTQVGALNYLWDFGNGVQSTIANPVIVYQAPGIYDVKLIVTDISGCTDTSQQELTVGGKPAPGFKINEPDQCLKGNSFSFSNRSSSYTGNLTYHWNFGDGTVSLEKDPVKSYAKPGTYKIMLTVISDNSCADSLHQFVTVWPSPEMGFEINANGQCIPGNNFVFTNTSASGGLPQTYTWDFGDGSDTNSVNATKTYTQVGTYRVSLKAMNTKGCSDSITKTVVVWPQPVCAFTVNDSLQCINNQLFVFTSTSTVSSGFLFYKWNFGDGTYANIATPEKRYNAIGNYKVTLTVSTENGCSEIFALYVYVVPKPNADFNFQPSSALITDPVLNFTNQSTGGENYLWNFGNGITKNTKSKNPFSILYNDTGTFKVSLTIEDQNGCADTLTKLVRIQPVYSFFIPNVFSPNNDDLNAVFKPVCTYYKRYELTVWNRWGMKLYESDPAEKSPSWNGVYLQKKLEDDNFIYMVRVIDFDDRQHFYKGIFTLLVY